jgi:hypothetical protein
MARTAKESKRARGNTTKQVQKSTNNLIMVELLYRSKKKTPKPPVANKKKQGSSDNDQKFMWHDRRGNHQAGDEHATAKDGLEYYRA